MRVRGHRGHDLFGLGPQLRTYFGLRFGGAGSALGDAQGVSPLPHPPRPKQRRKHSDTESLKGDPGA